MEDFLIEIAWKATERIDLFDSKRSTALLPHTTKQCLEVQPGILTQHPKTDISRRKIHLPSSLYIVNFREALPKHCKKLKSSATFWDPIRFYLALLSDISLAATAFAIQMQWFSKLRCEGTPFWGVYETPQSGIVNATAFNQPLTVGNIYTYTYTHTVPDYPQCIANSAFFFRFPIENWG